MHFKDKVDFDLQELQGQTLVTSDGVILSKPDLVHATSSDLKTKTFFSRDAVAAARAEKIAGCVLHRTYGRARAADCGCVPEKQIRGWLRSAERCCLAAAIRS